MTWFNTSVCSPVCEWYAKLILKREPLNWNNSFKKRLMNNGPQSETKMCGLPWSFLMISMNRTATEWDVWQVGNIPKWMPFEKWSTTTRMVVWPQNASKPVMKSSERSSHIGMLVVIFRMLVVDTGRDKTFNIFPEARPIEILSQACRSLSYAHMAASGCGMVLCEQCLNKMWPPGVAKCTLLSELNLAWQSNLRIPLFCRLYLVGTKEK